MIVEFDRFHYEGKVSIASNAVAAIESTDVYNKSCYVYLVGGKVIGVLGSRGLITATR